MLLCSGSCAEISPKPVSRELTPAGTSAHRRQHVQVTSPNRTSGPGRGESVLGHNFRLARHSTAIGGPTRTTQKTV